MMTKTRATKAVAKTRATPDQGWLRQLENNTTKDPPRLGGSFGLDQYSCFAAFHGTKSRLAQVFGDLLLISRGKLVAFAQTLYIFSYVQILMKPERTRRSSGLEDRAYVA